ncbi:peptidoglycan-binding protein LysM [Jannaschia pagri]|uniref:Peptidoglycan-binding protein LysM n=1 Tax=Jannaschia pagri TaxID=2829797 RepID=A0ABQ4NJ25_9RHOB|nr:MULTISPECIES: DUF2235 domain-containing protein [unclassified Jannaschia]GIT90571.1 peptidoglycan-binding protein LysM [Jannaschia sp. AI_61]GIT94403.1 peptidoglycan-binding protein LysM [Jannaschia sp. AI_62]
MKRIVILCDGTWNRVDAVHPTNVVRLGQALAPEGADGVKQVPIYIEGVGTGRRGVTGFARFLDRSLGGALGLGLMENMVEAYRHLVFLYEPGDEVSVFGFSRGAFTARTLVGFIRFSGLLARGDLGHLPEAVARYSERRLESPARRQARNAEWRALHSPWVMTDPQDASIYAEFGKTEAVPFDVAYMGVWDTVGALGIPGIFSDAPLLARKYAFHDTELSPMVRAARHALAIDERRKAFRPTRWNNLPDLNGHDPARPYRQEYFPGDHKAVGGGGDIRALSSLALAWIIEGAEAAGLAFDDLVKERLRLEGDPFGPLSADTVPAGGFVAAAMRRLGGPRADVERIEEVSAVARTRWAGGDYRPEPLLGLAPDLDP